MPPTYGPFGPGQTNPNTGEVIPDNNVQTQSTPEPALPEFSYDLNGVNPSSDLAHNAFLRGYGYDKQMAVSQAAQQRASLQSRLQTALPQLQQQLSEGLTDIGESSAARGAARSSSRLTEQNRLQRDAANREAALRSGIADQEAQVAFGLQSTLGSLENQRAESELNARTRLVDEKNQQIAIERAMKQMGYNG